jgi:hypothetical protein
LRTAVSPFDFAQGRLSPSAIRKTIAYADSRGHAAASGNRAITAGAQADAIRDRRI